MARTDVLGHQRSADDFAGSISQYYTLRAGGWIDAFLQFMEQFNKDTGVKNPVSDAATSNVLMPQGGVGAAVWDGSNAAMSLFPGFAGSADRNPFPNGIDPGFDPHIKFPRGGNSARPYGPGSGANPSVLMGSDGYSQPYFGMGEDMTSFAGIGLFSRACSIPNDIQPGIVPGGLFGPDAPIPWGRMPGYEPPPDISGGGMRGFWWHGKQFSPSMMGASGSMPRPWIDFDPLMGFGGPTWGGADPTEPLGKPDLFEMYGGVPDRIGGWRHSEGQGIQMRSLTLSSGGGGGGDAASKDEANFNAGYYAFWTDKQGRHHIGVSAAGAAHQQEVNRSSEAQALANRTNTEWKRQRTEAINDLANDKNWQNRPNVHVQSEEDFERAWEANKYGAYPWLQILDFDPIGAVKKVLVGIATDRLGRTAGIIVGWAFEAVLFLLCFPVEEEAEGARMARSTSLVRELSELVAEKLGRNRYTILEELETDLRGKAHYLIDTPHSRTWEWHRPPYGKWGKRHPTTLDEIIRIIEDLKRKGKW